MLKGTGATSFADRLSHRGLLLRRVLGVFAWRGPDGRGLSLQAWVGVVAAVWVALRIWPQTAGFATSGAFFLGLAVVIPILQVLARQTHARPLRPVVRVLEPTLVMVLMAVLTGAVFYKVLFAGVPIEMNDHHLMMARAKLFADGLAQGQLRNFTHLWQGGDSNLDLYPNLFNVLVTLVHWFTPKSVSFQFAYSLSVLFCWWLRGVVAYHLARRFAGPVVSALCALASLFDVGKDVWDGTWNATLYWGMIHNNFGLTLAALAAACQIDVARRVTTGRWVTCSLVTLLAALAHQLGVLYVGFSIMALAFALALHRSNVRRTAWALAASLSGILMASFWIVPNAHALHTIGFSYSRPGYDYDQLGAGLFSGASPTSSFGGFLAFGFIALTAALISKKPLVVASAALAMICLLFAVTPLMIELRVYDLVPGLIDGQPMRMMTVIKLAIVPAAAWLLSRLYRPLSRPGSLAAPAVLARAALVALLIWGPVRLLAAGAAVPVRDLQNQVPQCSPKCNTDGDYHVVFDWIKARREADPDPTPWRVAYMDPTPLHHATFAEGLRTGVPVVNFMDVPSNLLAARPREVSLRGFNDWNIRYAIAPVNSPPFPEMTARFTSGHYRVWEVNGFDDRFVVAPSGVSIKGLRVDGDVIRFTVEGAPSGGVELQVRAAFYPRWRARQNGVKLPLWARQPRPDTFPRQEQIALRASNGEVVISCTGAMPRFARGVFLSLVGVALLLGGARVAHRRRIESLLSHARRRIGQPLREGMAALKGRLDARRVRTLLLVLGVAGTGVAVLVSTRGSRHLFMPAVGGAGLEVSMKRPNGRNVPCWPNIAEGGYVCTYLAGSPALHVGGWMGVDPRIDHTLEIPRHWPAIRVFMPAAGTARLKFARVKLAGGALDLRLLSAGSGEMTVSFGNLPGEQFPLAAFLEKRIAVPPEAARVTDVTLEIRGEGSTTVTFAGKVTATSPAP